MSSMISKSLRLKSWYVKTINKKRQVSCFFSSVETAHHVTLNKIHSKAQKGEQTTAGCFHKLTHIAQVCLELKNQSIQQEGGQEIYWWLLQGKHYHHYLQDYVHMKCIPPTWSGTLFFVGLLETSNTQTMFLFSWEFFWVPHQLPTLPKTLRPYEGDYQPTFSVYSDDCRCRFQHPLLQLPGDTTSCKVDSRSRWTGTWLNCLVMESPTRMNVNTLRNIVTLFCPTFK